MPLLAGCGQRGQIVDVEMVPPGEVVSDAEAGHGERWRRIVGHGRDQAVTGGSLSTVHSLDELVLRSKPGPQFAHHVEGAAGMWRKQLDDHDQQSCQRGFQRPAMPLPAVMPMRETTKVIPHRSAY